MPAGTNRISGDGACHVVQFYADDDALIEQVAGYLADGVEDGEVVVVVATAAHRLAFDAWLVAQGIDITSAKASGCYTALDARDTMRQFVLADWPDADSFEATVGALIRQAHRSGRPVRVYGEMVALLWDEGHVNAAIELETLWNSLADQVEFSLFCAYPTQSVGGEEHLDAFAEVCHLHSAVVGPPVSASPTREEPEDIYRGMWVTIV